MSSSSLFGGLLLILVSIGIQPVLSAKLSSQHNNNLDTGINFPRDFADDFIPSSSQPDPAKNNKPVVAGFHPPTTPPKGSSIVDERRRRQRVNHTTNVDLKEEWIVYDSYNQPTIVSDNNNNNNRDNNYSPSSFQHTIYGQSATSEENSDFYVKDDNNRVISKNRIKPAVAPSDSPPASSSDVDLCKCGRSSYGISDYIVGGTQAAQGEFPWRAFILTYKPSGSFGCGGTILNQRWILTAAHCFENYQSSIVFAGSNELMAPAPIKVDRHIVHEGFNKNSMDNDIALIHLETNLDFTNPNIVPGCLPYGMQGQYEGKGRVVATGWGSTSEGGSEPTRMLKVELDMIPNSECKRLHNEDHYNDGWRIDDLKMCAYSDNKDTCQGDSGGSLDWQNPRGIYYALGVVSYGHGCARSNIPGVNTRVSEFLPWIEDKTGINFCKSPTQP